MEIREYLKEHVLLTDGAMGTYFDEVAPGNYLCPEEGNFYCPERILKIHKEYIDAGARLLRSNTFLANKKTFEEMRRRHPELKKEDYLRWVREGFLLAVQAAQEADVRGEKVYAAADIGPIFEEAETEFGELMDQYREIADCFLAAGAEVFVMESFPDERYVLKLARHIRQKAPGAFLIGQFSFIPSGYGRTGFHYRTVLKRAVDSGLLDAVGLNCGVGAAHMERFLSDYVREEGMPEGKVLTALPNRGYPQIVRGRAVYSDSVTYFGEKVTGMVGLGAGIIGGCCGTTPEYIKEIGTLLEKGGRKAPARIVPKRKAQVSGAAKEKKKPGVRNLFREKLERGEKVCAVELDPPFDCFDEKVMAGAQALKGAAVDVITIADSPLARSRADSLLMAAKIKRETGMDVMPHLSCRDRNRIGLRSGFLGAHVSDIRNILLVTGDPVGREERPFTKSVFDFNSIRLMQFLDSLNEEVFQEDPIFFGGALNQSGANPEKIADRMKKKMEAGCQYFLSQPVYSEEGLERLSDLRERTGAKILIGIMPLVSRRNALFIKNEMPGIFVPDEVLARYEPEAGRERWEEAAVDISRRIIAEGRDVGAGYYFITPFHRVSLIKRILEEAEVTR
ncbi:MAG: bifunctional homocysteine S-methyltransferase/methylenetetrahydrofolate reductase [Eubacteriales bacterium]|nr:bifunctional homocysteine S-methyltransferase/methylenetetrahydrofolate reductase [Eubacteriales bacterium]